MQDIVEFKRIQYLKFPCLSIWISFVGTKKSFGCSIKSQRNTQLLCIELERELGRKLQSMIWREWIISQIKIKTNLPQLCYKTCNNIILTLHPISLPLSLHFFLLSFLSLDFLLQICKRALLVIRGRFLCSFFFLGDFWLQRWVMGGTHLGIADKELFCFVELSIKLKKLLYDL